MILSGGIFWSEMSHLHNLRAMIQDYIKRSAILIDYRNISQGKFVTVDKTNSK